MIKIYIKIYYVSRSISLNFNLYHITKCIDFDLCAYSNVYTFMHTNYFLNRWFLISYLILTIPKTHFFKSKWLNNLVLIFIPKFFFMKYHDMIPITFFWIFSKNERFDNSSNIVFSLIPYLTIIITRIRYLNYLS